jgi:DNA polymerase-3 subunit alpha
MLKTEDFVHLHVHSDMSELDGCCTIENYVKRAKKRGNPAIAITDHGTMRGYYRQHIACKENDIKPIYGIEMYLSNDMYRKGLTEEEKSFFYDKYNKTEAKIKIKEYEEKEGIRDRWHLTLWAKNEQGLENLFYLSSIAYIDGFYYKPRIDIEKLIEHGDGIMVGSGCLASIVNDNHLSGKRKKSIEIVDKLYEKFGADFWFELQPHDIDAQRKANLFCSKIRKRYKNIGLLATQDSHYLDKKDSVHHDVMLCVGTHAYLDQENRFRFSGNEFHFRSRKSMKNAFEKNHDFLTKGQIKEALDNTVLFAEKTNVEIEIDYLKTILPDLGIDDESEYFKSLCFKGWKWRDIRKKAKFVSKIKNRKYSDVLQQYKKQLAYEINIINEKKFIPYFLVVHDICNWARKQNIMIGPGRGSASGSIVTFLLGITSVDPIEHDLLFERFMNPERIDAPDIDIDFQDSKRQEIITYLKEKYGKEKVAQIANVTTLKGKQCLRDVSRVLRVPIADVNAVSNTIIERLGKHPRLNKTLIDSFKEFDSLKNFNSKYPGVLYHGRKLEGLAKSLGIHAAGVVITPEPVWKYTPIEHRKYKDNYVPVTALDKDGVAAIGLVKIDILGLKTLTVLMDTTESIKNRFGKTIDLERINLYDKKVLGKFSERDFSGVFQFDTPSAYKICEGIDFEGFGDIPALNALNRPGATQSGLTKQWINKKKNPEKRKKYELHKLVSEIAYDTLGVICYQEHVTKILKQLASFDSGKAETIRKAIAKSKGKEQIEKFRNDFVVGCNKNGIDKQVANTIMSAIVNFGKYAFNKAHATAYGIIAYWAMWLKTYYPLDFYCSLLKNEDKIEKIQKIANDVKRNGIKILPPDVSVSGKHFSIDPDKENTIRGSLLDIKGLGEKAVEEIISKQPYSDFCDFVQRIERRKCNKAKVEVLIKAGAFSKFLPNTKWSIENIELLLSSDNKKLKNLISEQTEKEDYDTEEKNLISSSVNPFSFGEHPIVSYHNFIENNIKVEISEISDNFYKMYNNKNPYIVGIIASTKYARIGDYHTGELPNRIERKEKFWGARYGNVNIEGRNGEQIRVKFDRDVFEKYQHVLDKGVGTPILLHICSINKQYKTSKADLAIDVEELRKKIKNRDKLSIYDKIVIGKHPAIFYRWKNKKIRKEMTSGDLFHKNKTNNFCGIITHVMIRYDKNHRKMAFVGVLGVKRYVEVVFFADMYDKERKKLKEESLVRIKIRKQRKDGALSFIYDGRLKELK